MPPGSGSSATSETSRIVVVDSFRDGAAGVIKAEEQALDQEFITHPAVEPLDEAVLHRIAGRDVVPLDAMILRPGEDGVRGELGAVVGNNYVRPAATADQVGQLAGDTTAGDRLVGDCSQAFVRNIGADVQHPKRPSAGQLLMHKVQWPP